MSKDSQLNQKRFFRVAGAALVTAALFGLAMNLASYSPPEKSFSLPKIPVPQKLDEVLGAARELIPLVPKKEPEEKPSPGPKAFSLAEVKEEAKERVVTESKEIVREKTVEVLKELISKLTDEEGTKGEVCDQICEEVCQQARE